MSSQRYDSVPILTSNRDVDSDPVCWSPFLSNTCGLSPLHASFLREKFLQANYIVTSTFDSTLAILIIIGDKDIGCPGFVDFYQTYLVVAQIITYFIFQWIYGFITVTILVLVFFVWFFFFFGFLLCGWVN